MKNRELTSKEVAEIQLNYPPGTRILLNYMEDQWAVPSGTRGTVEHVDDAGQIHPKWDNGRTSTKKRDDFNRMIRKCKKGKINLILTKSISRFARNTLDTINYTRMLRAMGIGIYFEKENINTLDMDSEMLITMLGAFAQAESESISRNVAWGKRKAIQAGKVYVNFNRLYGYYLKDDGTPEINTEQAEAVKFMFARYMAGDSTRIIASKLDQAGVPTPSGKSVWVLGNHEYMMLQYLSPDATSTEIRRWNRNGNAPTLAAYLKQKAKVQQRIKTYLRTRPTHLELEVSGNSFYMVHGFPGDNVHDEVWTRPTMESKNPIPDCRLIIGHTKVLSMIQPEEKRIAYAIDLEDKGEHLKILHTPGFINLDCGCGYDMPIKALACLELESMREIYI